LKKILSLFCLSFFLAKKAGPKKSDPFLSLLLLFILLAKRVKNIKFSLPSQQHFLLSCFLSSLVIKRKRTHIKRERERAQQMRGKGGRALPLAINKVVFPRRRLKKNKALCMYIIL
jgi:hypothetical protein